MKKILACIALWLLFGLVLSVSAIPQYGFLLAFMFGLISAAVTLIVVYITFKLMAVIFDWEITIK